VIHYRQPIIQRTSTISIHKDWNLRWIISKVKEETNVLHGTILFKVLFEKSGCFHVDLLKQKFLKTYTIVVTSALTRILKYNG